jgi:hypothetical protein
MWGLVQSHIRESIDHRAGQHDWYQEHHNRQRHVDLRAKARRQSERIADPSRLDLHQTVRYGLH